MVLPVLTRRVRLANGPASANTGSDHWPDARVQTRARHGRGRAPRAARFTKNPTGRAAADCTTARDDRLKGASR